MLWRLANFVACGLDLYLVTRVKCTGLLTWHSVSVYVCAWKREVFCSKKNKAVVMLLWLKMKQANGLQLTLYLKTWMYWNDDRDYCGQSVKVMYMCV